MQVLEKYRLNFQIDEEIYDLLKRIQKTKGIENKYKDKATILLDKLLNFNEYYAPAV